MDAVQFGSSYLFLEHPVPGREEQNPRQHAAEPHPAAPQLSATRPQPRSPCTPMAFYRLSCTTFVHVAGRGVWMLHPL